MRKKMLMCIMCLIMVMTLLTSIIHVDALSIIAENIPDVEQERQQLIDELHLLQENDSINLDSKLSQIVTFLFDAKKNQLVNNMMESFDFDVFWSDERNQDNIDYFIRSLELEKETFAELRISLVNSATDLVFSDIIVTDQTAQLSVYEWFEYYYYTLQDGLEKNPSGIGVDYTIYFVFENNEWKINDIEFYNVGTEVLRNKEITVESVLQIRTEFATTVQPSVVLSDAMPTNIPANANAVVPTRSEFKSRFLNYALKYAGSARNTLFLDYTGLGGDCQNYGSQCVWYALGGVETSTAVNGYHFPMIGPSYANRNWYNDKPGNHSASWTAVDPFASYVNYGNISAMGLYGVIYSGVANAEVGDIIQISNDGGNSYGHTFVVTKVTGTAGNRTMSNVWVCSHTTDLTTTALSTVASSGTFRTVRVIGYIDSVS